MSKTIHDYIKKHPDKFEKDALQIATHIVNNDLSVAKNMFDQKIGNLKHFEAIILKDKIHRIVDECEKTGKPIADCI